MTIAICPICGIETRRTLSDGKIVLQIVNDLSPCTEQSLAPGIGFDCCPNLWLAVMDAGISDGVTAVVREWPSDR
jgi:hypothetical protein